MASERALTGELRVALAALFASPARLYPAGRRVSRLMLLDGSRGLAAVAVLIFHYCHFFYPPGVFAKAGAQLGFEPLRAALGLLYDLGNFGVQLFWMISGFVFAAVYYGKSASTREFVVNRFARLYPLHFATLLIVTALQFAAISRFGTHLIFTAFDLPHFLLQLAFASNWLVRFQLSFNGPIWSVSVEVVIYAVFWLTRRHMPAAGIVGPLLVAAMMMGLRRATDQTEVFNCGFHFFIGVALCSVWRSFAALPRTLIAAGALAMAAGAIGLVEIGAQRAWVAQTVMVPLLFGGMILLLVAAEDFAPARLRRLLGALGDRTYSIYLVHAPIQLGMFLVLGAGIAEMARHAWFLATYLGLVLLVAWPCYRWFEAPARDYLRRFARPERSAAAVPAEA